MNRHHRAASPRGATSDPAALRWSLLFVACETTDPKSADFLLRTALPRQRSARASDEPEAEKRSELMMRLLAVKALHAIATQHHDVRHHLLELIMSRPEPAVLLEAVAAAEDLGFRSLDGPERDE